jgi:N-acetylglucosaminyldiphosphoundecaprenol N-acetyl-beta-D-mannosaminyltransferase
MTRLASRTVVDKLHIVPDQAARQALLDNLAPRQLRQPVRLGFINAHGLNLCRANPQFHSDLLACQLLLRDGTGMRLLFRRLGRSPGIDMNGTDLIPELIERYRRASVALLGTRSPHLERAAEKISGLGCAVSDVIDGFQPPERYVEICRTSQPQLILLAMGMPRQERIAALLAEQLQHPCLIVCGGAILDFLGGKVQRAPVLLRRWGLEWSYRLWQEPRRLFARYIIGNATFMLRVAILPWETRVDFFRDRGRDLIRES